MRSKEEGWLQGFITLTTFTTWHRWFRWDSIAPESGVIDYSDNGKGLTKAQRKHREWMKDRVIDSSGAIARELRRQVFDGDPVSTGVVWPHIAEISLLGALGAGRVLVQAAIDALETNSNTPYEYIALQATEGSVPFYERMGFIRCLFSSC